MNVNMGDEKEEEIEEGATVRDSKGRIGKYLGIEEKDGEEYVKIDFGEYISFLPKSKAEITEYDDALDMSDIKDQERDRLRDVKRADLREHIKKYVKNLNDVMNMGRMRCEGNLKEEISDIIKESIEKGYIFRGDGRHPFAKSEYDKSQKIKDGIFDIGLLLEKEKDRDGEYGNWIHSTANIDLALDYPESNDMPDDWDRRRFIYVINPYTIYENIEYIDSKDYKKANEILSKDIPPEYIPYAIELVGDKVKKVYKNPNYLKTTNK